MQHYSQLWSWQTDPCESRAAAGEAGQPQQGLSDRGALLRGDMTLIPFLKTLSATLASPAQGIQRVLHEAIKQRPRSDTQMLNTLLQSCQSCCRIFWALQSKPLAKAGAGAGPADGQRNSRAAPAWGTSSCCQGAPALAKGCGTAGTGQERI